MTNPACYCGLSDDFTAFGQPYPSTIGTLPIFVADYGLASPLDVKPALLAAIDLLNPHLPYRLEILPPTQSAPQHHIALRFASGAHGDGQPFDGPGGVLAHATGPPAPGWLHMDGAETWLLGTIATAEPGFSMAKVLAHELGHNVGLGHSGVPGSLMFPRYTDHTLILSDDDLAGLEALYKTTGSNRPPAMFWGEDPLIAGFPPGTYDIGTDDGQIAGVTEGLWHVRVPSSTPNVAFRFTSPVVTYYSADYPVVSGSLRRVELNLQPVEAPAPPPPVPPPTLPPAPPRDIVLEVPAFTIRGRIG